jgi:hypothetical protein
LNTRSSVDRAKQTFIDLNTDFHCAALPDGLMYIYQITTTAGNVKKGSNRQQEGQIPQVQHNEPVGLLT